jgi:hypothetical protein
MAERRLSRADLIRSQQQRQRGWKLYSFHAPRYVDKGYRGHDAPKPASRVHLRPEARADYGGICTG